MATTMHPLCRQRLFRLRVITACLAGDIVACSLHLATGRWAWAAICGGFAIFAFTVALRFRRLLIDGCPGEPATKTTTEVDAQPHG